ncbi:MAG: hypothetical protein G01um101431_290 [Parcubacteria group bacterium Gr01-1014_31]|nr:MAG: hypothetical protein G01um101431_290 [Parcubacteria group bacterium Gr01-1014_31]
MVIRVQRRVPCSLWLAGFFIALLPGAVLGQTAADADNDGLTDTEELERYHTDPNAADTDGDGFNDGQEAAGGYSPRHGGKAMLLTVDSDNDRLNDGWELLLQTDLNDADTDGDGFLDGTEVAAGYDPAVPGRVKRDKRIDVSLEQQELTYSFGGMVLETFPISGGLPNTPTPHGDFTVQAKVPVKHYGGAGFDYPNTKWNLQFTTVRGLRYYIHGAYWHNDFGRPKSHGCVNVSYDRMERLYWFAQLGTRVAIQ